MALYDKLSLITLDPDGHSKTCNYWYLIQNNNGPHCAFTKRDALVEWLHLVGVRLTADLPEHGTHGWQKLDGSYRTESHMSYDEFYALGGLHTKALSNGEWTLCIAKHDADGLTTLHTLNPNCKYRPVYDYAECRARYM
jgi:hypothetical protein